MKVVLAYSGGLDTSIIISWLKENYGAEVVAYVADVGQEEELNGLEAKALKSGASRVVIEDLRRPFVEEFIWPTLRSGSLYQGKYTMATSLARYPIARGQAQLALKVGAEALSHGCTGKGNDQVRFELTFAAFAPGLKIIAPWRDPKWNITSREDAMDYAKARGIPVPTTAKKPYSSDRNLWHISYEGGILEDLDRAPSEDMFQLTKDPRKAPNSPETVVLGFASGIPVSLNNKKMAGVPLIQALNKIAGRHGVGRIDMVEDRVVGMKSRGVYESPAASVLYAALRDLVETTLDRDTQRFRDLVGQRWADVAYGGLWFSPLRHALDGFVERSMAPVSGSVSVSLFKGSIRVLAREPEAGLYLKDLASFKMGSYNAQDASGFMKLYGLQTNLASQVRGLPGSKGPKRLPRPRG